MTSVPGVDHPDEQTEAEITLPGRGLSVEVTNRPPVAPDSLLPGSGLGLVGLAERVTLAGGVLDCGPRPDGGWHVTARMPWPAKGAS